ncbi:Serine/threonine-protein phosphatase 2A 65 kDa regulatory subunit A beta isoform [Hibiscus syriacus]|uniref:Serine/threonine-protein phosphatase 2A 65 kDa regulatory subunit A beta isoform n=1 Tax=Hibiscus syriacus TaxID=106335 RepID=A0A6A2Y8F7_HIBSY|nr:Serine/threonine-protein phosphatase 2A 65 kDa regulatory subunit A beta isoform [Hibiscus syriacus]
MQICCAGKKVVKRVAKMVSLKCNWADNSGVKQPLLVSFRGNEDGGNRWKVFREKIKKSWVESKDFGRSDPRKVIFAMKMGLALSLASLLIFWKGSHEDIAQYSIWVILTVIVMFEFSIGATLIKGFNRGLGALCRNTCVLLRRVIRGSRQVRGSCRCYKHFHNRILCILFEAVPDNEGLRIRVPGIRIDVLYPNLSWVMFFGIDLLINFSLHYGLEPLYPIAVLIDELKNDDIQLHLNSIRRLSTIARALGEERTRKELIPFLSENNDDDDEVLLAMAEELGVLSMPVIGSQMRQNDLVDSFVPLVKRLAAREWFSTRVSSCGLFHIAYPSAPEMLKTELRSIYSQLCQDDMPMMVRSAASNLGKFAATVEYAHLKSEIMQIFDNLTEDDQDTFLLLAVEGCAALGKLLEPQDCVAHILPVIVSFSQENYYFALAGLRFLRDNEAKVRIAAAGKVTKFSRILSPYLVNQHILPCVKELSSDSSQHVRSALASVIMGMAPVLGKDATIEQLLPIFLSLLKDEIPDVRLNIISKLDQVNQCILLVNLILKLAAFAQALLKLFNSFSQVIGIDLLSQSLLPAIVELAEDRHWRVRLAIIEHIPLLASQLGVGFFYDKLGALCMQWLQDKKKIRFVFLSCMCNSYKVLAANNLKRLAEEFGRDWAMEHIIPQIPVLVLQFLLVFMRIPRDNVKLYVPILSFALLGRVDLKQ